MIRVGVKSEVGEYTVVVENPNAAYKRVFESYRAVRGPFGTTTASEVEARDAALADAKDWVEKFNKAGLKAELVEFVQ